MSERARKVQEDRWTEKSYAGSASFVPKLASVLLTWIDPQPNDRVLDIGCGDGKFTSLYSDSVAEVYGIDSSSQFIEHATTTYAREGSAQGTAKEANSKISFKLHDATSLDTEPYAIDGKWDKVVSNAALHWILRNPETRLSTLKSIHQSLNPQGGRFIFEMGGAGNAPEIQACLIPILKGHGFTVAEIRDLAPWFFPDTTWMTSTLESIGFRVDKMELVHRPTKLDKRVVDDKTGTFVSGGVEGWVRLMLAGPLDVVRQRKGEEGYELVVREICEAAQSVTDADSDGLGRKDGGEWLHYMRLRGVAVRES